MEDKYDEIMTYVEVMDVINKEDQHDGLSVYRSIKGHKNDFINCYLLIEWDDMSNSWEKFFSIWDIDPVKVSEYVHKKNLLNHMDGRYLNIIRI